MMKKVFRVLVVILLLILLTTNIYASSVYIEKVNGEENTSVDINKGEFKETIDSINKTNNEVEVELKVEAEELKEIRDNTEIVFVIDNSGSMSTKVNGTNATRKNNVVNSTKTLIEKIHDKNENIKMGIVCFANAATTLVDLTNDKDRLISNLTSFGEKTTTGETAMSRGLKLAKSKFSADANNKIIILLTDGMPTDDYLTVRSDLQDDNIYTISTLVGLENATKAEKRIISILFGTEEQPVPDKLYNITDDQVEDIISNDIYEKVIDDFKETIKDITIENEIPDEIINNFEIKLEDETKGSIEDNKILWNIPELESLENESLKYTLTLKEDFDESLINQTIDISKNVKIEYCDVEDNRKIEEIENIPQIIIKQDEEEIVQIEEPEQEEMEEVEEQQEEMEEVEEQQEEIEEVEEQQEEIEEVEEQQEEIEEIEEQQEEIEEVEEQQEENTKIELKETKQEENNEVKEEKTEKIEEKAEITTEQIEEQEQPKIVEKVEEKTIQADNTVANKELAYTGTNKTLIIAIGLTLVFAIYEGIKLIKAYKII